MIDDSCWTSIKILNEHVLRIDTKVVVNCRQKVAGAADAFDGIFSAFVGRSNKATGFDATAGPDV